MADSENQTLLQQAAGQPTEATPFQQRMIAAKAIKDPIDQRVAVAQLQQSLPGQLNQRSAHIKAAQWNKEQEKYLQMRRQNMGVLLRMLEKALNPTQASLPLTAKKTLALLP